MLGTAACACRLMSLVISVMSLRNAWICGEEGEGEWGWRKEGGSIFVTCGSYKI